MRRMKMRSQKGHSVSRQTILALSLALPLLAALRPAFGQNVYTTRFEAPSFVAGSPLVGQDDWVGVSILPLPPSLPPCQVDCCSPNAPVISTAKPRQGKQSVLVSGEDLVHQDFI